MDNEKWKMRVEKYPPMEEPDDSNKLVPGEGPYASPFGLGVVPRLFLLGIADRCDCGGRYGVARFARAASATSSSGDAQRNSHSGSSARRREPKEEVIIK